MFEHISKKHKTAVCDRREDETIPVVKNGLAFTPAQMANLAERGIPVSTGNVSEYYDGDVNPSWDIDINQVRGTDINDVWLAQKMSRKKIRHAHKTDIENYG